MTSESEDLQDPLAGGDPFNLGESAAQEDASNKYASFTDFKIYIRLLIYELKILLMPIRMSLELEKRKEEERKRQQRRRE